MHVAQSANLGLVLNPLAGVVEILAVLDHRGAEGANRRVLVGIVPSRHGDGARHADALRRERNRLAVIAGAGADDASRALVSRQRGDKVEAAANLERAGRVVVLVFDMNVEPGLGGEQRMPHQRRAAQLAFESSARAIHIVERRRRHSNGLSVCTSWYPPASIIASADSQRKSVHAALLWMTPARRRWWK